MKLKSLGIALFAFVALGAVLASSAFATPVTKKSSWLEGSTKITAAKEVKCSKRGTANFVLKGTVLGAETELTATGLECPGATISNTVVGTENMAIDGGKLTFTGVKVAKPAGCSVEEKLTTESLKTNLEMDTSVAGRTFDKFEPTGEKFISIKITGCAIAGTYPVKGSTYGRAVNTTGTLATNQPLVFDSETNGFSSLTLAGKPATITGEANNELVSGASFQAKEE
jgi:hypothetical protein